MNKFIDHTLQRECKRLFVLNSKEIDTVGILQCCLFVKTIQKVLDVAVLLDLNDKTDTFLGGFIADVIDLIKNLILRESHKGFQKFLLVAGDGIWNLGDHDVLAAIVAVLNLGSGAKF